MLLEQQNMTDRIKCGKCKSEYMPRLKTTNKPVVGAAAYDYSCPVCNHGKFTESYSPTKKILHD